MTDEPSDEWFIRTQRGAYAHSATVERDTGSCDVCCRTATCLAFDTSDGEYATLLMCQECINKAFDGTLKLH